MLQVRGEASLEMYTAYVKAAVRANMPAAAIVAACTDTAYRDCCIFRYVIKRGTAPPSKKGSSRKALNECRPSCARRHRTLRLRKSQTMRA